MENYLNKARAEQILGLYGVKPKQSRKADDEDENNDAATKVVLDATSDSQPDISVIDSDLNLSKVEKSDDETDDGMTTDSAQ